MTYRQEVERIYQNLNKLAKDGDLAIYDYYQYIDDLMVSGKLTEHDIVNSKKEKQEIMSELDKIKKDLDGLMKN